MLRSTLKIPEPYREGLAKLADASADTFERLSNVLEQAQPALGQSSLIDFVKSQIPADHVPAMMQSLLSLGYTLPLLGMSISELAQLSARSADLVLDQPQRDILRERLEILLSIPSITITTKGVGVLTEHANVFVQARIMTDIRPIFPESPDGEPGGAVIYHSLRIRFRVANDAAEFFVALDNNDLEQLHQVVDRAKRKARSLQRVLSKTGIPYLEVEGDAK